MLKPPLPPDEAERLAALHRLGILDTAPEERFDRITRLARELFDVPIALVSLIDAERQWFKSRSGLEVAETPHAVSFCGHTILNEDTLVVSNAPEDDRFAGNPLVEGEPHIRFYAGHPLTAEGGHRVGTLCLISDQPRQFTSGERDALQDLAALVEGELRSERLSVAISAVEQAHHLLQHQHGYLEGLMESVQVGIIACDAGGILTVFNRAAREMHGIPEAPVGPDVWTDRFSLRRADGVTPLPKEEIPLFRALQGETVQGSPMAIARPGGPARQMLANARPIKGPAGETLGAVVAMLDVSESKLLSAQLRKGERRQKQLLDGASDLVQSVDGSGKLSYVNRAWCDALGYSADEAAAKTAFEIIHPAHRAACQEIFARRSSGEEGQSIETVFVGKDGREIAVEGRVSVQRSRGRLASTLGIFRDVTERRANEAAVQESRRLLRGSLDSLTAHIAILDAKGEIQEVNESWRTFAQANGASLSGCGVGENYLQVCDLSSGECAEGGREAAEGIRAVLSGARETFSLEYPCHSPTEQRWFMLRVTRFRGAGPVRGVVAHEDITSRRKAEDAMRELAYTDVLTQLPNRRRFHDRLEHAVVRAARTKRPLGLMFLDLDRFKAVNDLYGHDVGDAVIQAFGARIVASVREVDTVSRLSGDEFTVLLEDLEEPGQARVVAERILKATAEPLREGGHLLQLGASIGVVIIADGESAKSLLKRADEAMYVAKQARGTVYLAP